MQRAVVKPIIAIVLSLFIALPGFAQPETHTYPAAPSAGAIIGDLFLARPAGLVATVVGTAVFIVALPFSLPSRSVDSAAQALVVKPATFTFVRPLGQGIRSY
jgi:hypothetical protein